MPRRPATVAGVPSDEYAAAVGRRLAAVRVMVEPNQAECARQLSVNQSTWNKYEAGHRLPPPYTMAAFCERYGCSMDWIFRGRLGGLMDPELERRLGEAGR